MNRNRIRICGRNTITAPTPANTPSTISERRMPLGQRIADHLAERQSSPPPCASAGMADQANTAWNIDEQDRGEDQRAGHRVEQNRVEPVRKPPDRGFADDRAAWRCRARGAGGSSGSWLGPSPARILRGAISSSLRLAMISAEAALADRDGLDHRHAELLLELARVEFQPVALGEVDHVEGDDRRQAEVDQLQREAEVIVEVGGVEHDQQRLGQPLALLLAEQHVARHRLVGAGRIEPVGAGQVDQLDRRPSGSVTRPTCRSTVTPG